MSGLTLLDALAETRVEEAIAAGTLDDIPGAGRPLVLDDDRLVPDGLRAAYRILKNAGFLPPEVEARREIARLGTLLATLDDKPARRSALTRLACLEARLESGSVRRSRGSAYYGRILARFMGDAAQ
jgi:hypothetical protein